MCLKYNICFIAEYGICVYTVHDASPQFMCSYFCRFCFYSEGWMNFAMPNKMRFYFLYWARGFTVHDNVKCIQYCVVATKCYCIEDSIEKLFLFIECGGITSCIGHYM